MLRQSEPLSSGEFRALRLGGNAIEAHLDTALDFFDRENLKRFRPYRAGAGFQAELVAMQRTYHFAAAEHALGKRTQPMRAAIARSKYLSVALTKYRESLAIDHVTASLSQWNGADTSQIHHGYH